MSEGYVTYPILVIEDCEGDLLSLAYAIGLRRALVLATLMHGVDIYIPASEAVCNSHLREICRAMGRTTAREILAAFAGGKLYLESPRQVGLRAAHRYARINPDGLDARALALRLGISSTHAREALAAREALPDQYSLYQ